MFVATSNTTTAPRTNIRKENDVHDSQPVHTYTSALASGKGNVSCAEHMNLRLTANYKSTTPCLSLCLYLSLSLSFSVYIYIYMYIHAYVYIYKYTCNIYMCIDTTYIMYCTWYSHSLSFYVTKQSCARWKR